MSNIIVILDGETLPLPNIPFTRPIVPVESDVETLDGTIYTDFTSYRKIWNMKWDILNADQYEVIENIFRQQYINGSYPILRIDYYDVSVPVKMTINSKSIQNDGCNIVDVEITLTEQFAVS